MPRLFCLCRRMHRDVLEWLLFLNTHDEFTYYYSYGDKDTVLPAFQLAGKQEHFYQVSWGCTPCSPCWGCTPICDLKL